MLHRRFQKLGTRISTHCRSPLIMLMICFVMGALVSVACGQDANFDLRNYHIYNVYNVLAGRFDVDFFPAGSQTGYNPTLDFPYVLLALGPLAHYPRLLAAFMGLWYGALIFVTLQMASRLFVIFPKQERPFLILLGTLTAVTGAVTLSEVGTTLDDISTGMLVLAGLFLILKSFDNAKGNEGIPHLKHLFTAGVLFGLSAGLKLTGSIYALAICLTLLAFLRPPIWIKACALFSMGWLSGFLPPFSWWAWKLWTRFQNPFFPIFNNVFKSPLFPPFDMMDNRFFPRNALQWMAYPLYWAFHAQENLVIEPNFRDPRMGIAYVAISFFIFLGVRRFRRVKTPVRDLFLSSGVSRAEAILLVFLILSYMIWLISSSILRYALVIEVLSVLCTIVILEKLVRLYTPHFARTVTTLLIVLTCMISIFGTRYMEWGRVDYGEKVFDVDMSWAEPNTLFIGAGKPIAYLAAFTPPETHARFVGFGYTTVRDDFSWPFGTIPKKMIHDHKGPIKLLITDDMWPFVRFLPSLGLAMPSGSCKTIKSNLDVPLGKPVYACSIMRVPSFPDRGLRKLE